MDVRLLGSGDLLDLESFLSAHRDTSMFLRSNVRKAGIEYAGEPFQATYVAGYQHGVMMGVVGHAWNGMLLLQAPEGVEELTNRCVQQSDRRVGGLSGPLEQVRRARRALGLEKAATTLDADEALYALTLSELVLPAPLVDGSLTCRAPSPSERDLLCGWRLAYDIEACGAKDTPEARQRASQYLNQQISEGNVWVVLARGEPVSLAAFNATLPDMVQLGGIYTPPRLRGRGYAKAGVAGALQVAIERGATRAVLFTASPNAARSYEAVGFCRAGDYGLVLLK